ncbi:MAG: SGNH/GDSL hydrolase family protein [Clostridia bacterium]|nr:SGNH/GDSL hydrolase family protein [Clostridia bacterium]
MKKRSALVLLLVLTLLLSAGCAPQSLRPLSETAEETEAGDVTPATPTEPEETPASETEEAQRVYSVLFIGNSYTYYNDMPTALFQQMARSAGVRLTVDEITKGGHTLEKHASPSDTYGAKVIRALSGEKQYDFVILQEQSVRPASEPALFYKAVRTLVARIREHGAIPILYSTWGRKTGSDTLTGRNWTNESMTWRLAASYQAIGDELGIPVAHAGLAFFDLFGSDSPLELYSTDKSHPSYNGSYLAAATLVETVFDIDPETLTYRGRLKAEDATALLAAAKRATRSTPAIPEEYRTSSVGVG